jgi:hypothetical protein
VFQVLVHVVPDMARGLELVRNPGRVIGFHPLSITPGTDIGLAFNGEHFEHAIDEAKRLSGTAGRCCSRWRT